MQKFITYGFLLPPRGEEADLTELLLSALCNNAFVEHCKSYIDDCKRSELEIFKKFSNYVHKTWDGLDDPYTRFCIQVLGWCKVGNLIFPEKRITLTGAKEWHQSIYNIYSKHGYEFNFISTQGPIL